MKRIQKFFQLPHADQFLLIQTLFWLGSITFGVRVISWLKLQRVLLKGMDWRAKAKRTRLPDPKRITWAIRLSSRYIPKATCLPQALVAQHLLTWYGYPADFRIGVLKTSNGKIEAHAWVTSNGINIIGGDRNSSRFVSLSPIDARDAQEYGKVF